MEALAILYNSLFENTLLYRQSYLRLCYSLTLGKEKSYSRVNQVKFMEDSL